MDNIVFDFGNVLVRWEPGPFFQRFFGQDSDKARFFLENVCSPEWNTRVDRGEDFDALVKEKAEEFPEFAPAIRAYKERWQEMVPGEVPQMADFVRRLKKEGRNVFGLSNFHPETFRICRERLTVLREIENYMISGDVGWIKPEPEIYLYFLQKFNLKAEDCLFIDDSKVNIDMAKRFGFETLLFRPSMAKYLFELK